jgi:hypothetical protein
VSHCPLDLVFSFGSALHYDILLEDPSAERPIAGLNVIDASRSKKALGYLYTHVRVRATGMADSISDV